MTRLFDYRVLVSLFSSATDGHKDSFLPTSLELPGSFDQVSGMELIGDGRDFFERSSAKYIQSLDAHILSLIGGVKGPDRKFTFPDIFSNVGVRLLNFMDSPSGEKIENQKTDSSKVIISKDSSWFRSIVNKNTFKVRQEYNVNFRNKDGKIIKKRRVSHEN